MHRVLSIAVPVTLTSLLSGCISTPPDEIFDPRALGDRQRQAASTILQAERLDRSDKLDSPYLSTDPSKGPDKLGRDPLLRPLDQISATIKLDLRDAVQRAVVSNNDIRVSAYLPGIDEARVVEAEQRFAPTLFGSFEATRNDQPTGLSRQSFGGPESRSDALNITAQTGIRQLLPSGGQIEISAQGQRAEDFSDNGTTNYESILNLQLTQPLLRDFGLEVNRARIVINRNNQVVSTLDFRRQVEESVANVEQIYWQLAQAERDLQIQQELLERTLSYAEILWQRRDQDASRVSISQANARVESRRAILVRARSRVGDLSDQLKLLINDPQYPVGGGTLISTDTTAVTQQIIVDPKEQVETALQYRFELAQQQLRVDNARLTLNVAKNNLLPQLDLVLRGGLNGVDETFGGATGNVASVRGEDGANYTAAVGFQFEIPIGNGVARAIYRRQQLTLMQSITSYKATIDQVTTDVQRAIREIDTTWQEMVRTRQSAFAAKDALDAIEVRERAGEPLTPTFVDLKLSLLENLAQAASSEAASIANYNVALSNLERTKGTLLRYNNIVLKEERILPRGR